MECVVIMTEIQLNILLPPDLPGPPEFLRDLHARWPYIEPWGPLLNDMLEHVISHPSGHVAMLLSCPHRALPGRHRWHLLWSSGVGFYASGGGWRDHNGRSYLQITKRSSQTANPQETGEIGGDKRSGADRVYPKAQSLQNAAGTESPPRCLASTAE